ncbi:hypothetical protein EVAR_50637_1 [Eumeta japonica]|uniref:Uncharacterized protein n=1 Tax=Eumeta variegata TaxID=151549 RepID=A0A4C1XHD6_EUMVA|nr:hypothetical protein EVAR_50637_1 [Eumeta japonica]
MCYDFSLPCPAYDNISSGNFHQNRSRPGGRRRPAYAKLYNLRYNELSRKQLVKRAKIIISAGRKTTTRRRCGGARASRLRSTGRARVENSARARCYVTTEAGFAIAPNAGSEERGGEHDPVTNDLTARAARPGRAQAENETRVYKPNFSEWFSSIILFYQRTTALNPLR